MKAALVDFCELWIQKFKKRKEEISKLYFFDVSMKLCVRSPFDD